MQVSNFFYTILTLFKFNFLSVLYGFKYTILRLFIFNFLSVLYGFNYGKFYWALIYVLISVFRWYWKNTGMKWVKTFYEIEKTESINE